MTSVSLADVDVNHSTAKTHNQGDLRAGSRVGHMRVEPGDLYFASCYRRNSTDTSDKSIDKAADHFMTKALTSSFSMYNRICPDSSWISEISFGSRCDWLLLQSEMRISINDMFSLR